MDLCFFIFFYETSWRVDFIKVHRFVRENIFEFDRKNGLLLFNLRKIYFEETSICGIIPIRRLFRQERKSIWIFNWQSFQSHIRSNDTHRCAIVFENLFGLVQWSIKECRSKVFFVLKEETMNEKENSSFIDNSQKDGRDEYLAKWEIALLTTILFVTVFGNSLVLFSIYLRRYRARKKLSRMYFFIMNLSIADLLTGLLNVLPQLAWDITYR